KVADAVSRQLLTRRHSGDVEGTLIQPDWIRHLAAKVIGNQKQQEAITDVVFAHTMNKSIWIDSTTMHRYLSAFAEGAVCWMPQLTKSNLFWQLTFEGAFDLEGIPRNRHLPLSNKLLGFFNRYTATDEDAVGSGGHFLKIESEHCVMPISHPSSDSQ